MAELAGIQIPRAHVNNPILASSSCPMCFQSGKWRSGVEFDHQMICMRHDPHAIWCPATIQQARELDRLEKEAVEEAARQKPVTIEWLSERWKDIAWGCDLKDFELLSTIHVIFQACVGGWGSPYLHVGRLGVPGDHFVEDVTQGEIEMLCKALRIPINV